MELHKRRKAITEPETRYFMRQILLGVDYLHDNKIIHRDLKLGNVFLNDDMECKIGDFGLATRVDFEGERKKTLCGTPNYIAPEVLGKKGHSYEVDVWSLGCIMYTLLVGKPPFETQTLKDTYTRIRKNEYHVPSRVGPLAKNLIQKLLQHDPDKRPSVAEILGDDFMTMGYLPHRLPVSCLTMAPRFDTKNNASLIARRTPLMEVNHETGGGTGVARKDSARYRAELTCLTFLLYVSQGRRNWTCGLLPGRPPLPAEEADQQQARGEAPADGGRGGGPQVPAHRLGVQVGGLQRQVRVRVQPQ